MRQHTFAPTNGAPSHFSPVEGRSQPLTFAQQSLGGFPRFCAISLALMATGTSAWISTVAGWERGGEITERVAWIFVGLVLLFSAHLIPALSRNAAMGLRMMALALWATAMLATGYTHATFFIAAQQHAGEARARKIDTPSSGLVAAAASPGRTLDQIAGERAQVQRDIAIASAQHCRDKCPWLTVRQATLNSKLTALNIEVDEARRRERSADQAAAELDRVAGLKRSAMADPVTYRLAALFNVSPGTVDLGVALAFGWLLEGVACVGWLLALPQRSNVPLLAAHLEPVSGGALGSVSNGNSGGSNVSAGESNVSAVESNVAVAAESAAAEQAALEVTTEPVAASVAATENGDDGLHPKIRGLVVSVERGEIKPTVKAIRAHLECSQERAMEVRQLLKAGQLRAA